MQNKLLITAVNAALKAGKAILEVYKNEKIEAKLKADLSPLTLADKNAHTEIIKILEPTNIPVLSEEGRNIPFDERKNWKYFWMIDPLDGTKEFIKKNGEFTVNIALICKKQPVLGVVYVPVSCQIYFALKGKGAYRGYINADALFTTVDKNYTKLPVYANRDKFIIAASHSHINDETKNYIQKLKNENVNVELILRGSSLKICMVAEGEADIYPRFGPTMEWDIAAGHVIAIEAGCSFTKVDEISPVIYNKENLLNPYFIVKAENRK